MVAWRKATAEQISAAMRTRSCHGRREGRFLRDLGFFVEEEDLLLRFLVEKRMSWRLRLWAYS